MIECKQYLSYPIFFNKNEGIKVRSKNHKWGVVKLQTIGKMGTTMHPPFGFSFSFK